mmetsp:Transcript_52118/g.59820  ORF Transcript_52118/g.59820 Transcript_52118/m.59820 type:complete len:257 (+) Transcript_52118:51-821(+)
MVTNDSEQITNFLDLADVNSVSRSLSEGQEQILHKSEIPHRRKRAAYVYHHISNEKRNELLRRVLDEGERQAHVAKDLGINYSSAKSIVTTYKKFGRVAKVPHHERITKYSTLKIVTGRRSNDSETSCLTDSKLEVLKADTDSSDLKPSSTNLSNDTHLQCLKLETNGSDQSPKSSKLPDITKSQQQCELMDTEKNAHPIFGGFSEFLSEAEQFNQYVIQQQKFEQQIQILRHQQMQLYQNMMKSSLKNKIFLPPK